MKQYTLFMLGGLVALTLYAGTSHVVHASEIIGTLTSGAPQATTVPAVTPVTGSTIEGTVSGGSSSELGGTVSGGSGGGSIVPNLALGNGPPVSNTPLPVSIFSGGGVVTAPQGDVLSVTDQPQLILGASTDVPNTRTVVARPKVVVLGAGSPDESEVFSSVESQVAVRVPVERLVAAAAESGTIAFSWALWGLLLAAIIGASGYAYWRYYEEPYDMAKYS